MELAHIELASAVAAGLATFFSPCVLPLIPGYISLVSGISAAELTGTGAGHWSSSRKAGLSSLIFVLGFTAAFVLLGASASAAGRFFQQHSRALSLTSGIMLILFGVHASGLLNISFLNYEKRVPMNKFHAGLLGSFFMGLAFAIGWSPCIGPILAGLLTMSAADATVRRGITLLAAYSLGLGIPFIATGFATGSVMAFFRKHRRFLRYSETFAGVLLIAIGLAIIFRARLPLLKSILPIY